jgi:hypothetical protein
VKGDKRQWKLPPVCPKGQFTEALRFTTIRETVNATCMNLDFAGRSDPLENAKAAKEISRVGDRAVFEMPAPTPLIGPDDSVSGLICTATGGFSTFQD